MKTKIALFLGLIFAANISYADLKVGVVNFGALLEKSPQYEKAGKRLEQEFSPRQKQLVSQQRDIQSIEERLNKDSAVISETERNKLQRDILNKARDYKRSEQEFKEDFNMKRTEELGKVQRRIAEAITSLAKEQGFDLVLAEGVVYASEQVNITAQVQQKLTSMPE